MTTTQSLKLTRKERRKKKQEQTDFVDPVPGDNDEAEDPTAESRLPKGKKGDGRGEEGKEGDKGKKQGGTGEKGVGKGKKGGGKKGKRPWINELFEEWA